MNKTYQQEEKEAGQYTKVPVSQLIPSLLNIRNEEEDVASDDFRELCNSIRENGLIEPIIVRRSGPGYEVLAGSRRRKALVYLGIKEAKVIIRNDLSDQDAQILSLVENIHRKNISQDSLESGLKDIYRRAEWHEVDEKGNVRTKKSGEFDIHRIEKFLLRMHNDIYNPQSKNLSKRHDAIKVPEEFRKIASKIGYSPTRQYYTLHFGITHRPHSDTNYIAELYPTKQEIIKSERVLQKHPSLQNQIAHRIMRAPERKAKAIVKQYVHDLNTGAIIKDKVTGEYDFLPSKREVIEAEPEKETNAVRARDQIIRQCAALFKLLTNTDLDMSDIEHGQLQARTNNARDNMKNIASYNIGPRELAALQNAVSPAAEILNHFEEILYNEAEK